MGNRQHPAADQLRAVPSKQRIQHGAPMPRHNVSGMQCGVGQPTTVELITHCCYQMSLRTATWCGPLNATPKPANTQFHAATSLPLLHAGTTACMPKFNMERTLLNSVSR